MTLPQESWPIEPRDHVLVRGIWYDVVAVPNATPSIAKHLICFQPINGEIYTIGMAELQNYEKAKPAGLNLPRVDHSNDDLNLPHTN